MARDLNRDWAIRLAEAGLAVFPCNPDPASLNFKHPLIKWRSLSSSDTAAVAQWWEEFPGALPGIDLAKADLVVLDGDRHGGPDGVAALRELLRQQRDFNGHTTPTAHTPGNGVHVYFSQNGHALGNAEGDLPAGINVRGHGGYTIAPYAVLPDGRSYRLAKGTPDLIASVQANSLPHVPQGIVELIKARKYTSEQPKPTSTTPAGKREAAYGQAALQGSQSELAGCAKGRRNQMLNAAAYHLGRMVARGWIDRIDVESALIGAMHANGYLAEKGISAIRNTLKSGLDDGMTMPHPDLADDPQSGTSGAPIAVVPSTLPPKLALTSAEFVAGFTPPDYLIVGWLQRRFVYSITAATGDGKTAIALLLTLLVSRGFKLGNLEVKCGRVLYFAGENPDDVRMRWLATTQQFGLTPEDIDNVFFVPGSFKFTEIGIRIHQEMEAQELALVVVDTSATYFETDDENNNMQALAHAKRLRQLSRLPGGPTVAICCHPTKNATPDNLIPRGGGAFLNEVDGNLTCKRNDLAVEMHWNGKFRGPDFEPLFFQLKLVTHERLKDTDGNLIQTVVAQSLTAEGLRDINARSRSDEDQVLVSISKNPRLSSRDRAEELGWRMKSGEPYHMRVVRAEKALEKARLIIKARDGWELTERGKKEAGRLTQKEKPDDEC